MVDIFLLLDIILALMVIALAISPFDQYELNMREIRASSTASLLPLIAVSVTHGFSRRKPASSPADQGPGRRMWRTPIRSQWRPHYADCPRSCPPAHAEKLKLISEKTLAPSALGKNVGQLAGEARHTVSGLMGNQKGGSIIRTSGRRPTGLEDPLSGMITIL
jgi:hypothetical protein